MSVQAEVPSAAPKSPLLAAGASAELWRTPAREAWATVEHRHLPVDSREFRDWLGHRYYTETGDVPSNYDLDGVVRVLCAKARYGGPQHQVRLRVAEHEGAIWIDLADAAGRTTRGTPEGCKGESQFVRVGTRRLINFASLKALLTGRPQAREEGRTAEGQKVDRLVRPDRRERE